MSAFVNEYLREEKEKVCLGLPAVLTLCPRWGVFQPQPWPQTSRLPSISTWTRSTSAISCPGGPGQTRPLAPATSSGKPSHLQPALSPPLVGTLKVHGVITGKMNILKGAYCHQLIN